MARAFDSPLKGSTSTDTPKSMRFLLGDAKVLISVSGILMPGETERPDGRRRANRVLSRNDDGMWTACAYTNS
ncbi:hypothetical protein ACGFWF_39175 [Streptomyces sp. NPDC048581]|uniref:hypothetical protein n=1 Tax=Streptomyces sp. NPDC048581 TaxID=3365572 RepID=UPI00371864F4